MSAKSICDGCGTEEPMTYNGLNWFKPYDWYERTAADGSRLTACSKNCIDRINENPLLETMERVE